MYARFQSMRKHLYYPWFLYSIVNCDVHACKFHGLDDDVDCQSSLMWPNSLHRHLLIRDCKLIISS